jgi:ABC-type bacteriocin/lantibiotic exporter with double-glycine peptidase domain
MYAAGRAAGRRSRCTSIGRDVSHDEVIASVGTTTDGTAATPIVKYLRKLGLRAGYRRRMSFRDLARALTRGAVVLVDIRGTHWAVAHAVSDDHVWLADPSIKQLGRRITKTRFRSRWTGLGVVMSERASRRGGRPVRRARTPLPGFLWPLSATRRPAWAQE